MAKSKIDHSSTETTIWRVTLGNDWGDATPKQSFLIEAKSEKAATDIAEKDLDDGWYLVKVEPVK